MENTYKQLHSVDWQTLSSIKWVYIRSTTKPYQVSSNIYQVKWREAKPCCVWRLLRVCFYHAVFLFVPLVKPFRPPFTVFHRSPAYKEKEMTALYLSFTNSSIYALPLRHPEMCETARWRVQS